MGIAGPRYYDPYYYPPPLYYPPPPRILYVNQPSMVPIPTVITSTPTTTPIITNNRMMMVSPTQNVANPLNNVPNRSQISNSKMKNTIENIEDFVEEQELTENMLEKGRQKNCSICLENYLVGDKIVYLPCFHFYHTKCIQTWVKSSDKCPLCNVEIKFQ